MEYPHPRLTWLPLRPIQGSWPYVNISHSVTPNIQVSLAWEKVRVFRLSGAHLEKIRVKGKASWGPLPVTPSSYDLCHQETS